MVSAESDAKTRRARLFRNGSNQAIHIPREFEFNGEEVLSHREGNCLIVEPVGGRPGLLETLRSLDSLDESFPDVDEGLPPLDPIRI